MRPEKVFGWRELLPPPFDQPRPAIERRKSVERLKGYSDANKVSAESVWSGGPKRRNSAPCAVDQADRRLSWLRFVGAQHARLRQQKSELAVEKLKWLRDLSAPAEHGRECFSIAPSIDIPCKRSTVPKSFPDEPSIEELLALTQQCFPTIGQSKVIITEYSKEAVRTSEYTLEEVLASECILQPGNIVPRVRWIYVEYYKTGTFWGSDYRFAQWGTDPALFEKSPISLLQDRLAELDRQAGRPPLEQEDIPEHKRIGQYYRESPGCPEFLGLRVNSEAWFTSGAYGLLLDFLAKRPILRQRIERDTDTDLAYYFSFVNAVKCIRDSVYKEKPGLREVHHIANIEGDYIHGSWDDTVERVEFYREHTLLSCGSPRFYKNVADRLQRKEDVLRLNPDCALLYYTLARVSIENDEMMQDGPERALNKVFARLKSKHSTDREHVELVFSLQRAVLDGLEYLEENKRELPIWGIPPFDTHQVNFHPEHSPSPIIRRLIQDEMDYVDKDFDQIIGYWKILKDKVDRYLDVLLQFRVLEQQELALSQSHLATEQQSLAVEEARAATVQSRAVIVFTAITIVFLPLSFFTSYFGMNLTDIVQTNHSSKYFWLIAGPVSGSLVIVIFVVTRCLNTKKARISDEEKGISISNGGESDRSWRSLLSLTKGKVKSS